MPESITRAILETYPDAQEAYTTNPVFKTGLDTFVVSLLPVLLHGLVAQAAEDKERMDAILDAHRRAPKTFPGIHYPEDAAHGGIPPWNRTEH